MYEHVPLRWIQNLMYESSEAPTGHLKSYSSYMFREGNGTPLQYFCLENPMDGGAW